MKIRKNKDLRLGFVVDSYALERLASILGSANNKMDFSVYLADGTSYEFNNIKDVLNLQNSKNRPIKKISVETPFQDGTRATVSFRGDNILDTIGYNLTGEEKDVLYLADKLDEWIGSIKPWYSRIATVDFVSFLSGSLLVVFAAVILITGIVMLIRGDFFTPMSESKEDSPTGFIYVFFFVFLSGIVLLANIIRSKIFPVATFAIGDGIQRHHQLKRWRELLGAVFILSVLANVITSLIV